jgi:hypothetical protein
MKNMNEQGMSREAELLKLLWHLLVPIECPSDKTFEGLVDKFDVSALEFATVKAAAKARLATCALDPRPTTLTTWDAVNLIAAVARHEKGHRLRKDELNKRTAWMERTIAKTVHYVLACQSRGNKEEE